MGKESNLLEAARTGNLQIISNFITKLKKSNTNHKKPRKLSLFSSNLLGRSQRSFSTSAQRISGLDCSDLNGGTPLHLATLNNHKAAVTLLINGGAQITLRDNQGCIPLHLAAWTGNVEISKLLLTTLLHSDINAQNKSGDTALHIASQYGHTAVVRLLLQHEANPMIRNVRGESSLDLSAFYGRLETVSLLIHDQPALLHQIQHSHSPLHLAARNGQKDVVRKLLQAGYNINSKTMSGSALHESALYGKVEVLRLLLQSGIDKSIKDNKNQTAEEMLASHNNAMSHTLLQILRGQENVYHSLDPAKDLDLATQQRQTRTHASTSQPKLCKHGKLLKDDLQRRKTRERSLSGQTSSGTGSSPPSPPLTPQTRVEFFPHTCNSEHKHYKMHSTYRSEHSSEMRPSGRNSLFVSPPNQQMGCHHCKFHTQQASRLKQSERGYSCTSAGHMNRQRSSPAPSSHSADSAPVSSGHVMTHHGRPEKTRHKSASAMTYTSDYIKLSETSSYAVQSNSDNHVYNGLVSPSNDHCYDAMDANRTLSPIYHPVPKPYPIADAAHRLEFSPLSPHLSATDHSSMDRCSAESQDSVYDSPGSLSPDFNGPSTRKYLGHVYVNLSQYRSTPDLHKLTTLEAPRKPPRTQTTDIDISGLCKSTDYVCVDIPPDTLSDCKEVFSSESSLGDRLDTSGGDDLTRSFVVTPKQEKDDEVHEYENMRLVFEERRSRTPPKAMPRKSKSKQDCLSSVTNNNEGEVRVQPGVVSSLHSPMAAVEEDGGEGQGGSRCCLSPSEDL